MEAQIELFGKLPEEIATYIFEYLNVAEILNASLVSKRWYNIIGKSKRLMENIEVKYCWELRGKDINSLLKSARLYQNFKFAFRPHQFLDNPNAIQHMRSLVNKFCGSIVRIFTTRDINRVFELPKLKELTFLCPDYKRANVLINCGGLLNKAKSLEILTVINFQVKLDKKSIKAIKQGLNKCDKLKELNVFDISYLDGWEQENYKFQLQSFARDCYKNDGLRISANNFVAANSSTLTELHYFDVTCDEIIFLLSKFPKLRKLCISSCKYAPNNDISYPLNRNIQELVVFNQWSTYENTNSCQNLAAILPKLLNLQILEVKILSGTILDAVFGSNSIRTVKYVFSKDVSPVQVFRMLNNPRITFF